jgi:hypothetical protein
MNIMNDTSSQIPVPRWNWLGQLGQRTHTKRSSQLHKWLALLLLGFALAGQRAMAAEDFLIPPGAVEPGGDTNDTTVEWTLAFGGPPGGSANITYIQGVSSEANIGGSLYFVIDCVGGPAQGSSPSSPNLAIFLSMTPGYLSGWLGNPGFTYYDLSAYSSISFDIMINTDVSSNTDVPIAFWAQYSNDRLEPLSNDGQNVDLNASTDGFGMGLTDPGSWTHVSFPITPTLTQYGLVNGFGAYEWYNTSSATPPAHLEFWIDNMRLAALTAPPPPPSLTVQKLPQTGLLLDSSLQDATFRHEVWTINSYPWEGNSSAGSPVTYSMNISSVPNPAVYSNWEANIFLAPTDDFSNPENNGTDVGWLQILDNSDGTATATMHWKTNSAFDYAMLYNSEYGGQGGTNNTLAAGLLGTITAPSMVGAWSISFTSDTNFTVSGPGGVSTNLAIPETWVQVWDADAAVGGPVAYAYFGDDSYTETNQGLMWLSSVSISGGISDNGITNNFTAPLDPTAWGAASDTTVVPDPALFVEWTAPAAFYSLVAATNLDNPITWLDITNNPAEAITIYEEYNGFHAIIPVADFPATNSTFFALNRSVAVALQVLMPGETNSPGAPTGKIGTPSVETVGTQFNVTVNALDLSGNIMTGCNDPVTLTSSDPTVGLVYATLTSGTITVPVTFGTTGGQTLSVTDGVDNTVSATGSVTTVNP